MIIWNIPLRTVSEVNSSEHWASRARRHKHQQYIIRLYCVKQGVIKIPCHVKMTRFSRSLADDDNLPTFFKYIRDELSEYLIPEKKGHYVTKKGQIRPLKGRADNDPRITWTYAQEKANTSSVRIEISFPEIPDN
jgi:hypothetical protein